MREWVYRSTVFLTSALVGGEWSALRPGHFTTGEEPPSTHWIVGWVGPRAVLDDAQKRKFMTLPGLELRLLNNRRSSNNWSNVARDASRKLPQNMWLQMLELRLLCGAHVFVVMSEPISEQLLIRPVRLKVHIFIYLG
jgi:hypothetical protein